MPTKSLMDTMAEMMSTEYRQVIDNMLLNNLNNDFNPYYMMHHMGQHEVEVEFDD